jgi:hypothetical protein
MTVDASALAQLLKWAKEERDDWSERNADRYWQMNRVVCQIESVLAAPRAPLDREPDDRIRCPECDRQVPERYDTICDHYREMARRFAESRDELKHEVRKLTRELAAARPRPPLPQEPPADSCVHGINRFQPKCPACVALGPQDHVQAGPALPQEPVAMRPVWRCPNCNYVFPQHSSSICPNCQIQMNGDTEPVYRREAARPALGPQE